MSSFTGGNPAGRFALMVSLLPAFALFGATEYFVDRSRPDDTGDGKSVETAKRTIQAAVDAAASGDTITVLPGVYDEGENADKDGMPNRVVIDNKKLTIRSRDGRDSTHIVGFHDPQPEDAGKLGLGQDAVRCVCIQGDSQPVVTLEGFTIRDGATRFDTGEALATGRGGGVHGYYAGFYIVDCVISNCVAVSGGGSCRGRAVRTLFSDNAASSAGAAVRDTYAFWSIITRSTGSVVSFYSSAGGKVVNCTYVENGPVNLFSGNKDNMPTVDNSIIVQNSGPNNDNTKTRNCVITGNIAFSEETDCRDVDVNAVNVFVATAYEDYRLLAGSPAVGCASVDRLSDVPEAYRLKDFNGAAVTADEDGALNAGAIQESVTPSGGTVLFSNTGFGTFEKKRLDRGLYANAVSWPTQYQAHAELDSGSVFRIVATGLDTETCYRYPDRFGDFAVTAPAEGTLKLTAESADTVLWVTNGVASTSPTGTKDDPFNVIQDAVDAAPSSGKTLICVMPGVYDRGGKIENSHSNRVCIGNGKIIGLVSTEGAERTVILGAPDPDSEDGFGESSVRCLSVNKYDAFVRGFTITGGYADAEQSAGVWGNSRVTVVMDSIISNNVSKSSATAARNVTLLRCRVTDNRCSSIYGILTYCTVLSSLVYDNVCTGSGGYLLRYSGHIYDSTVIGDGMMRVGSGIVCRNSVFGSLAAVEAADVAGCLKRDVASVSAESGWTDAELLYADAAAGDFRLYSLSTGLDAGVCNASDIDYLKRSTSDFFGDPAGFTGGNAVPGALKTPIPAVWVVCRTEGIAWSGIEPEGSNIVVRGSVFTATATRAGHGNFNRFEVNGVFATSGHVLSLDIPMDSSGDTFDVAAVYDPFGMKVIVR